MHYYSTWYIRYNNCYLIGLCLVTKYFMRKNQGPDTDDAITGLFWFNLGDLSIFFTDGAV